MKRMAGAIAAATATFVAAIGLITTGAWLISMAALRPPLLTLEVAIVSVRAFGIARGSFRWLERVISHDAALHATVEHRASLWHALATAGPHGAWALRRGDAITRLMQDAEVLQDRITRIIVPAAAALMTAAGAALLQVRLQTVAGLAFICALLIAGVVIPLLVQRIEIDASEQALHERATLNSGLAEFLQHRDELRVLGLIDSTLDAIGTADARRLRIETQATWLTGATQWTAGVASGLAIAAALLAGVPALIAGTLPGPALAVIVLLPWSASEVVTALALAASANVRVRAAEQRLSDITPGTLEIPELQPLSTAGLDVAGLNVYWTDVASVHDVRFAVRPGERVAIVGPSGAGKSSILSALLGLVPYSGVVAAGRAADERAHVITAVPQAPHVFRTTLRENLRLAAGPVEDEPLRLVLESVGLQGIALDRDLGAEPLSGGEAQRLGLARALLTRAPVVLLDEPTEHLDEVTAVAVMASIRAATTGRALLMTTHRLTDLRDFDRIHILGDGTIMMSGTYDECLAKSEWFRDAVGWRLDKARVD